MASASNLLLLRLLFLLFLLQFTSADDVKCLQQLKHSLIDPHGRLSSWDFTNTTVGSICNFDGVECWNSHQNRILKLQLRGFHLSGRIFHSLKLCSNLEYMDISGNSFSGPISSSICTWLPYLVTLDLSDNKFSGAIPSGIGSCAFLNRLDLSNNQLSGGIPSQLGGLIRLSKFSVANNELTGRIPSGLSHFDKSDFEGNHLCGKPMGKCGRMITS